MNVEPPSSRQPANSLAARAQRALERAFLHLRPPHLLDEVDHPAVLARVEQEAGWSNRYAFMVLMSAGIAILGLLLSSPAVIIGAMLVSPLMGPIIGLGFAIAVFDWAEVRKSLLAVAAGALLAIAFTAAIVFLSPLTDRTPEILARTRPNLFDLLVAIFSALAGGYATVRGRGETIVGVAIATALMPPLAVVGFGLATADWSVFTGALTLFVTNFVAIALSATIMAKFYGFGSHLSPEQSRTQGWAILGVFLVLAVPLGFSLQQIAWETLTTRTVRDTIAQVLGPGSRIDMLDPDFSATPISYSAIVVTPKFVPEAHNQIREALDARLDRPVSVRLQQLVADQDLSRALLDKGGARRREDAEALQLRDHLGLLADIDPGDVTVDRDRLRAIARIPTTTDSSLQEIRALEARALERHPGWDIQLVPPLRALPPIHFPAESATLDAEATETATLIGWALARWRIGTVGVIGHHASNEPAALAEARAAAVAEALQASGVETRIAAPPAGQDLRQEEREFGLAGVRRVEVSIGG
ncbi:TIGR00341 family protein [Thermaurantiacus sp.]